MEPIPVPVPLPEAMALAARLEASGEREAADRLLGHVLSVAPSHPGALHLKAILLASRGAHEEAAGLLERAITHGLDDPRHWRNLCAIYERLGRLDEARAAGERAVALDPTDAESYHNLTVAHARSGDNERAIACARRALALDPGRAGAHMALAEALLSQGDYEQGWEEYEWRFRLPGVNPPLPATDRPHWDGGSFEAGTLLLVADQGFGDVIQFCRYLGWVQERCRDIVLAASRELAPLLRRAAPGITVVASWKDCPPYRAWAPLSGLPRLAGTRLDTIPAPSGYLQPDAARRAAWAERLTRLRPRGHRLIGLVWAGRPAHPNDRNRSLPLSTLAPLLSTPQTAFAVLQKGQALAEIGRVFSAAPLLNLSADITDFEDTAAILTGLDLLISVDTSVAHLAGALGCPAWIMLPFAADWRWLNGGDGSPWYDSVRLFRQDAPGNWEGAVKRLRVALAQLVTA